jgi:D-alanyl-D-alanine carboxypeptidase
MLFGAKARTRRPGRTPFARMLDSICLLFLVASLAACAGSGAPSGGMRTAPVGMSAPGPANDPWGPYIREASQRFDVPEAWIRSVMKVESGGRTHLNGRPIVSRAGAMGLMQVMPATYEELRRRHGLGPDPFNPRDNILAGTAYLREMYDVFGSPGFLAAYNAGPGRYGEYLAGRRALPAETRNYVAMISPQIEGIHPARRAGEVMVASARPAAPAPVPAPAAVAAPPPPAPVQRPAAAPVQEPVQVAALGDWAIQVGAFRSANDSHRAIEAARLAAPDILSPARRHVMEVSTPSGQVYRARLVGVSPDDAARACALLTSRGTDCLALPPAAQTS